MAPSFAFGIKFHKCAQVRHSDLLSSPRSRKSCLFSVHAVCLQLKLGSEPPQLTFYLMIDNSGPAGGSGTNLSQVAIRDSTSGIVPIRTEGRVVERGYQTFAIDSLSGKCRSENVTSNFYLLAPSGLNFNLFIDLFPPQLDPKLLSITPLK